MPTLNIYIPEDLAKEVEAHKGQMNVSRVCADALRGETQRLNLLKEGLTDREALVERLRLEKRETMASVRKEGSEYAANWVKSADYGDLKQFGEFDEADDYGDFRMPEDVIEDVREIERETRREGGLFDWVAFTEGWHEYVRGFWEEIKDDV